MEHMKNVETDKREDGEAGWKCKWYRKNRQTQCLRGETDLHLNVFGLTFCAQGVFNVKVETQNLLLAKDNGLLGEKKHNDGEMQMRLDLKAG